MISALPPSDYSVKAEKTGFKTFLARQITLPVGAPRSVWISLSEVGQVSEQVNNRSHGSPSGDGKYRSVSGDEPEANCRPAPKWPQLSNWLPYPPEPFPRWPTAAPNMETATNTSLWAAAATHRPII